MLIGETLTEPRVNDGMSSAGGSVSRPAATGTYRPPAVTPRALAIFTTLHRPTFCSSIAK